MRVNISNKDKTTHLVGCAQHFELFEDEWMQKWESTINRDWTVVCDIWVKKYREFTHTTKMAAKRGGYQCAVT